MTLEKNDGGMQDDIMEMKLNRLSPKIEKFGFSSLTPDEQVEWEEVKMYQAGKEKEEKLNRKERRLKRKVRGNVGSII